MLGSSPLITYLLDSTLGPKLGNGDFRNGEKKIFGKYRSALSYVAGRDYIASGGVLVLAVLKILC